MARAYSPATDDRLRLQPKHHQRPAVVARCGEEQLWLAEQQGLFLRFVADVEHRDIGADHARLPRRAFGVGPHEALAADPEVEAVDIDLLHVWQPESDAANVVGISHRCGSKA
jgi:hypothetical protein